MAVVESVPVDTLAPPVPGARAAALAGLAGNFGFEQGHYEVSMACAERVLLPAVRAADAGTEVLADGFSCRTQLRQAGTREPVPLAQHAARALGVGTCAERAVPTP